MAVKRKKSPTAELKPGDTFTLAAVNLINPPGRSDSLGDLEPTLADLEALERGNGEGKPMVLKGHVGKGQPRDEAGRFVGAKKAA